MMEIFWSYRQLQRPNVGSLKECDNWQILDSAPLAFSVVLVFNVISGRRSADISEMKPVAIFFWIEQ